MTDEQVIKRRLLIDGDGTGDERRLNVLQKYLIKLCNGDNKPEEITDNLNKMLIQLSQCEHSVKKSRKVASMNNVELENYKELSKKITLQIEEEKKKIAETKLELQEAKRIRKNKMEYNSLGRVINQQPDRKKSESQLALLKKDIEALNASNADAIMRLDARRRQLYCLILMLNQLKSTMAEPEIPLDSPEGMDADIVEVEDSS